MVNTKFIVMQDYCVQFLVRAVHITYHITQNTQNYIYNWFNVKDASSKAYLNNEPEAHVTLTTKSLYFVAQRFRAIKFPTQRNVFHRQTIAKTNIHRRQHNYQ